MGSESRDLPAFVSLVTVGRGIPGGSASWSSGFLPSSYSGTQFRSDEAPVLNLNNPKGIDFDTQQASIVAINDLNRLHMSEMRDSEPVVELPSSIQDDLNDMLEQLGSEHRKWLVELWKLYKIEQEPLYSLSGELIAEPIFWFQGQDKIFSCFGQLPLDQATKQ